MSIVSEKEDAKVRYIYCFPSYLVRLIPSHLLLRQTVRIAVLAISEKIG